MIKGRRDGYHHGDLRNALVEAATELASAGGPEAVVLREAARRVGVSPTAAYRHFAGQSDLLEAVKDRSQEELARSMDAAMAEYEVSAAADPVTDPGEAAVQRSIAVGRGYLRFAFDQPGLFRTAFHHVQMPESPAGRPTSDGTDDFRSFDLLSSALDDLLATGRMPPARRPGAEIAAWSAVHGLAVLVTDGPLSWLKGPTLDTAIEALLHSITAGLCAP
jgi:AcrR family transcriptional regulator